MNKSVATGTYADKDRQFRIIFTLIALAGIGCPVVSIDCKKKERLGNLYREGKCYCTKAIEVHDHDYAHLGEGRVVPFGLYDILLNKGYVSIGKNGETAELVADHILWWWDEYGINQYPDAKKLIVLCDAGGANCYRHHAFKKQILDLAEEIGIDIVICHYPPYSSKWNPIEHRMFAHVHRAMQGAVLSDYQMVKLLIEKTHTKKGLEVVVRIVDKEYKTGIKTNKQQVDYERIVRHGESPELTYMCKCEKG